MSSKGHQGVDVLDGVLRFFTPVDLINLGDQCQGSLIEDIGVVSHHEAPTMPFEHHFIFFRLFSGNDIVCIQRCRLYRMHDSMLIQTWL